MATNTQTPRHKLTIIEDELILELASVIVADGGGTGVPGEGDMLSSTYDPQGIEGDAFDMANMTEGADAKVMTAAERNAIAALGTASTREADQNLRTTDAVEFASVSISEILSLSPTTEPVSPTGGTIYLDSTINRLRIWDGLAWQDFSPFNPLTIDPIFAYYAELSMLADGGGAAAQGDSIATLDDLSANSIDATQSTALYQPIAYDADNDGPFARFDGSNDRMSFTLADPIENGTVFFATKKGSYAANIELAAGTHDFSGNKIANNYNFANDLVALLLFDFALSQSQIDQLKSYFVTKGAVEDYGAETILNGAWRNCSSITNLPLIDTSSSTEFGYTWFGCSKLRAFPQIQTSQGTYFYGAWAFCLSLTAFPPINLNSSAGFGYTWAGCLQLAEFPAGMFDGWNPASISNGAFDGTWDDCSSLTSQSVENILTSIDTSGKWATTNGASGGTPLGDPVIDIDYDGSTLTTATTNAISNLKGKDWGITINGVLQ